MNTALSYDSNESQANPIEPTALNAPQSANYEADSHTSTDERSRRDELNLIFPQAELRLSICKPKLGESTANLVYWALESAKQSYLKTAEECSGPDGEDFEPSFHNARRLQEVQNALFDEVCDLAAALYEKADRMHKPA